MQWLGRQCSQRLALPTHRVPLVCAVHAAQGSASGRALLQQCLAVEKALQALDAAELACTAAQKQKEQLQE